MEKHDRPMSRKRTKVRNPMYWQESRFYRFPALELKDTLIFVGVCFGGGIVFDGILSTIFGVIAVIMLVHFLVYSMAYKFYKVRGSVKIEPERQVIE